MFAYVTNVACDENNYILDFEVNSGNKHDSTEFPKLYKKLKNTYSNIENIVVDAGYKTPAIAKEVLDDGKKLITPYKRPMTKVGFFKKYEYVYDEQYDCYICPNNELLTYSTTNRDGYKEYKSDSKICEKCEYRYKCTESKNTTKVINRHLWEEYLEKLEDIRHDLDYKKIYKKRSETIERVFADAKELHTLRYTRFKGIDRNKNFLYLLFSCMNLKKYANKLHKHSLYIFNFNSFLKIKYIFLHL